MLQSSCQLELRSPDAWPGCEVIPPSSHTWLLARVPYHMSLATGLSMTWHLTFPNASSLRKSESNAAVPLWPSLGAIYLHFHIILFIKSKSQSPTHIPWYKIYRDRITGSLSGGWPLQAQSQRFQLSWCGIQAFFPPLNSLDTPMSHQGQNLTLYSFS